MSRVPLRVHVAAPCDMNWSTMKGDDRKRFCSACQLNVYNLSDMTRDEATSLIEQSEGRLCIRYYKRADGTVLTKNCPVGKSALARRVSKLCVGGVFALLTGLGSIWAAFVPQERREDINFVEKLRGVPVVGAVVDKLYPPTVVGAMPMMGKVAVPTTPPSVP